jgi:hypothetical protein
MYLPGFTSLRFHYRPNSVLGRRDDSHSLEGNKRRGREQF